MAHTYQFEFKAGAVSLVVDIDAETRDAALEQMRTIAKGWSHSDDPETVRTPEGDGYARVWIDIDQKEITQFAISADWPTGEECPDL